MHSTVDVDERVSQELSAVIEAISGDPDLDEAVTLGLVRDRIRETLAGFAEADRVHMFGDEDMLCAEVDALIDEYGEEVLATELSAAWASEDLSIIIEALMDDTEEDVALSLGAVRRAMAEGLLASLVGDGLVEPDAEQTLRGEVDALIDRLGEDTPAETVLRFD